MYTILYGIYTHLCIYNFKKHKQFRDFKFKVDIGIIEFLFFSHFQILEHGVI